MPTPEQSEAQEHDHVSVPLDLDEAIRKKVLVRDKRFEIGAYLFLYEALAFTQKVLGRDSPDMPTAERHVTGQELLDGIRQYAAAKFGPLAPTVFRSWGLQRASGPPDALHQGIGQGGAVLGEAVGARLLFVPVDGHARRV